MDPRKKQVLIGIARILIASLWGFLAWKGMELYTPQDLQWSVNQPQSVPTTMNTWTVEKETGTNKINTPSETASGNLNNTWTIPPTTSVASPVTVSLLIPAWVDTPEFQKLLTYLSEEYAITTTVRKVETIDEYKSLLRRTLQRPEETQLVLVPTNWIESFTQWWYKIPFKESISPLYDPLFRPWVDHEQFTYIPYALDPLITLYNPASFTPQGKTTFSDLQSALLTPRKTSSSYIPLVFGIDAGDLALLEQGKTPYPGYLELLEVFVTMDALSQTTTLLDYFNQTTYRDTSSFHSLTARLAERVESCQYWPHLCLLAYDIGDFWFGWLHEREIVNYHFPNARTTVAMTNLPVNQSSYPVTGRGRIVNKEPEGIPWALRRVKWYLDITHAQEPVLHQTVFSALNSISQRQRIEDKYLPLSPYISSYSLTVGSLTDSQKLIQKTPLLPMLRGEYSKAIFMKKLEEVMWTP